MQLAQRLHAENKGTRYARPLGTLAKEIAEDRAALRAIMETLDVNVDPVKVGVAWASEKAGRLKLNGRLVGYSPLSRLLELEGLLAGVEGKLGLWRALRVISPAEPRLDEESLDELIVRAERQLGVLREQHGLAAEEALPG